MVLGDPVVDDSYATAFACSLQSPSQLSDSTGPLDDVSGIGPVHQEELKHVELRVIEVDLPDARESCCFDKLHLLLYPTGASLAK